MTIGIKRTRIPVPVGKKFGQWTVLGFSEVNQHKQSVWNVRCECGTERGVVAYTLRVGRSTNCGCVPDAAWAVEHTTHGGSKTRLYTTWEQMKSRCNNPKNIKYQYYGGRGIRVCPEWDSFEAFRLCMEPTWKEGLTLDRIRNDEGYSPLNCRWATRYEQATNKRNNRYIMTMNGPMILEDVSRMTGIKRGTLKWRAEHGITGEDLFSKERLPRRDRRIKPASAPDRASPS